MPDLMNSVKAIFSSEGIPASERARHDVRAFFICFIVGGVVWMLVLSCAAAWANGIFLTTLGTLGMFSAAAMIAGGLIGFLFGIPRVFVSSSAAAAQSAVPGVQPNTNLEQISDWLTKVLVGVGLTELGSIKQGVHALSGDLAHVFEGRPSDGPVLIATLVTFGCSGFLWAYFESRTSFLIMFRDADK